MSNMKNPSENTNQKESTFSYHRRVNPIKEQILSLGEKDMDNTLWVIRKWLNNEMELVNKPSNV